jgi:MFS family permease
MNSLAVLAPLFPESGPYRVDQVTSSPLGMGGLFLLQVVLAALIDRWGRRGRKGWVLLGCGLLAAAIFLFFLLASWGLGDVNRLSHLLVKQPFSYGLREPFWALIGPLVRLLPYRFTAVHAALALGFALSGMLIARRLTMLPWAGWWALLIVCSPFLRNFLQSGVTRQGLATLLLLPLFLQSAGILPIGRGWSWPFTLLAATVHSSFPGNLALALSPRLLQLRWSSLLGWRRWPARAIASLRGSRWTLALAGVMLVFLIGWLLLSSETTAEKLADYLVRQTYFPRFLLSSATGRLQLSMVVAVVVGCWSARLDWRTIRQCRSSRNLVFLFLLLLLLQFLVDREWAPQLISRFQDGVAFYLLVAFLAWTTRYHLGYLVTLPLLVTLDYWLFERIIPSGLLACGANDEFLCIPDRWPWQVVYWQ